MSTSWNAAAEAALERHLDPTAELRTRMRMAARLRARVERVANVHGDREIGPEDVARALTPAPSRLGAGILLCGVLLPILSVLVAHAIGGELPGTAVLPTPWHTTLVLTVPAACLLGCVLHDRSPASVVTATGFLAGIALATALAFALGFLPMAPMGIVGILFAGFGLLLLSPYLAAAALGWLIAGLSRRSPGIRSVPGLWPGLAVGIAAVAWLDLAWIPTAWLIRDARPGERATWGRTIRRLRVFGNHDALAAVAHGRRHPATVGPLGSTIADVVWKSWPEDEVRTAAAATFHQLTGESCDSAAAPKLTAVASRMDGTVDTDAGVAYLEWQLLLRNGGPDQAEATAEIRQPPDAVVSRLTLWVGDEEREAAWSARDHVQRAYEAVVHARRDPVLVTTCGPGRVEVRCFPVVAGSDQRFKLGITVPLLLLPDEARLVLPDVVRSNFARNALRHEVWLEASRPLRAPVAGLRSEGAGGTLRGAVTDTTWRALAESASLRFHRDPVERVASTAPARGPRGMVVCEHEPRGIGGRPEQLYVVLDAGLALAPHRQSLRSALLRLAGRLPLVVLVTEPGGWRELDSQALAAALDDVEFTGGVDAQPALEEAWDRAAGHRNPCVLWLCGPQPWLPREPDGLRQRFERRPDGPRLRTLQLAHGTNRVLRALERLPAVGECARVGDLEETLDLACGLPTPWLERRYCVLDGDARLAGVARTSDHLARLQAAGEVAALLAQPVPDVAAARNLALAHHVLTPVTGAVVLETQQQYEAAGLTPIASAAMPHVPPGAFGSAPEPATWVLLGLGAAVALLAAGRRRT